MPREVLVSVKRKVVNDMESGHCTRMALPSARIIPA